MSYTRECLLRRQYIIFIIYVYILLQLKLYAAQQEVLGFTKSTESIGFTLHETSVTTTKIPLESDVVIANLYSSILWLLYAVSVIVFLKWYHDDSNEHRKKWIHKWIKDNKSLTAGMFTTAVTVGIIESGARIAYCSIWTHYTLRNNPPDSELNQGVFLAVWLPQGFLFICGTILLIVCHSIECYITSWNGDLYIHAILPLYLIAYSLVYTLFPAIILILAYPTQIIATLTFVLAYLFATTIFSAILYKWYEQHHESRNKNKFLTRKATFCLIVLMFFIWVFLLCLQFIAIVLLYLLLIGRGSAINTGPLFAISLLPSLLLSGVAWLAKRVALNETDNTARVPPKSKHSKTNNKETA